MELKFLLMVTNIKENIEKGSFMEKENILGLMVLYTKGISSKEWEMEMEHGSQLKTISIYM